MNAYELADDLESYDWYYEHEVTGSDGYTQEIKTCNTEYVWDAANMLRQQADRIAELEKQCAKYEELIASWNTPQTKPLSDEEIIKIFNQIWNDGGNTNGVMHRFARAIEERHGIK